MIDNPVRTSDDVDSLSISNTDDLGYVGESIQQVVRALAGRVPVIGFAEATVTAQPLIEGGFVAQLPQDREYDVHGENSGVA